MFSFRVEYAIRVLIEIELRAQAGIAGVPAAWLKDICGGDARGLAIVLHILVRVGWITYDKATYLYSGNVNIDEVSIYDVCLQIEESLKALPKPLQQDKVTMKLKNVFEGIKLSDLIL